MQTLSQNSTTTFDLLPFIQRPAALASLYKPRERTVLRKPFGGEFLGTGMIGLPVHRTQIADHSSQFDYEIWQCGHVAAHRSDVVKEHLQPYVPFIAKKDFVPLHVDMIPSSSFGASLANLLERDTWKEIRRPFFINAGYVCQLCGEASGPVEGHEVWSFEDGRSDKDGWHIQRLQMILCLCHECHEVFHPGLADIKGRSQLVRERLCALNCWTTADHGRFSTFAKRLHRKRSNKRWKLDLSYLKRTQPFKLSSRWQVRDSGLLTKQTAAGLTSTRITGGTVGY